MEKVRYMISDAAALAGVETHVLRYWEEELDLTIPRNEMGHRYYTRENIQEFQKIKELKEKGYQLKAIRMILHNKNPEETKVLVTFEDLLEEIVGEIDDETDKSSIEVREIGENTYIVEGAMTLNDFNEHFDTELESDDVDTIAGYYLTGVGAIPTQEVKEHYSVINKDKHLEFINDKVKDGRVTKLKVIITAAPEEAEE